MVRNFRGSVKELGLIAISQWIVLRKTDCHPVNRILLHAIANSPVHWQEERHTVGGSVWIGELMPGDITAFADFNLAPIP